MSGRDHILGQGGGGAHDDEVDSEETTETESEPESEPEPRGSDVEDESAADFESPTADEVAEQNQSADDLASDDGDDGDDGDDEVKLFTHRMPLELADHLDELVEEHEFISARSHAINYIIRECADEALGGDRP